MAVWHGIPNLTTHVGSPDHACHVFDLKASKLADLPNAADEIERHFVGGRAKCLELEMTQSTFVEFDLID